MSEEEPDTTGRDIALITAVFVFLFLFGMSLPT
jgi:hypothetical protein